MKERGIPESVKKILRPAIRERLDRDDCDGCFDPLGNLPRRTIVTFGDFVNGQPTNADFLKQHKFCFDNAVPARRRDCCG